LLGQFVPQKVVAGKGIREWGQPVEVREKRILILVELLFLESPQ